MECGNSPVQYHSTSERPLCVRRRPGSGVPVLRQRGRRHRERRFGYPRDCAHPGRLSCRFRSPRKIRACDRGQRFVKHVDRASQSAPMIVIQARRGMALVAVLAIMSLLAILAVATLSVTTRLSQGSALAARDAHLDAAASYALATALIEWRQRGLSSLGTGSSGQIDVAVPGSPVHASVTITRLGSELFWIVAEAVAVDDSRRRENIVVRLSIPRADSMSPLLVAGDVSLSRLFTVAHDSTPGCAPI